MSKRTQIKNQLQSKLNRNHNGFPWYVVEFPDGKTDILNFQAYYSLRAARNAEIANDKGDHAFQTLQHFANPEMALDAVAHPSKLIVE